jgi:hypothetical protein
LRIGDDELVFAGSHRVLIFLKFGEKFIELNGFRLSMRVMDQDFYGALGSTVGGFV